MYKTYKYKKMGDVLVSVVVPIRNEIAHVGQMLDTLFNQDCPSFEVIVVDGMSDDGTYEYLIEQSDNRENLRVLRNADKVTPRALNIGILASKGDYIAILGAHCLYENSYLNTCVKFLEKRMDMVAAEVLLKQLQVAKTS